MNARTQHLIISIAIGLFLLFGLMALPQAAPPATADTVPTPVAIMNPSSDATVVTFFDTISGMVDAGSSGLQLSTFEYCNYQWITDQEIFHGVPTTTTLTVQWSMDNSTWSDGPALVSNNVADGDGIVQVPNLGRYTRVYKDVTASVGGSWLTTTVKALCK
jgi:hypothetical protein